ncbi:hypothetical protein HYFRA_00004955 [Hymenoscyphus fraxineus]|uniref:Ubiquitin-like domain-containing protein n=1 Tax=Hymenoscyphus fraxineus TaxID=746836 RepID=A0A9N9KL76_9HELO|nr:hypothetical protein HYFRA_00004955 [Hymenoscyphus fraxineus]
MQKQGCCLSHSTTSNSPYPPEPNSSSRGITSSQPQSHSALPRPSTHGSNHSTHHSTRHTQPLSTHINRPLKRHVWTCKTRLWTRTDIDRERTDFFDTRVSGRPEIWQTLRAALEILRGSEEGGAEGEEAMATAQLILDAAGITLPTGDLANGAYDGFGGFYPMPEHIVADPTNMAHSPPVLVPDDEDKDGESDEPDEEEILRRREEKGKAVVNDRDLISVTARLSDGAGQDVVVSVGKDDTVRFLARRLLEEAGLSHPKSIRIAYMGKILKDNQSLTAQGWNDQHIINALVFG